MNKYRVTHHVEAKQWFERGDHDNVEKLDVSLLSNSPCIDCDFKLKDHGKIKPKNDVRFSYYVVCPGDYIVTGINGEYFSVKPDVFHERYERID
ncbi:MAG: hypothetical protein KAS32_17835 [Candidatus Peribacteraceae bacterium]|nr:hypothetical protein [Candidatus Peribacteraceae bacterium]